MSIQGNNGFLDLENSSLRVTGNVHAEGFKVGSVRLQSAYSLQSITGVSNVTNDMIQFTNPTKSFDATSNIEVGNGNLFVNTTTSNVGIGTNVPTSTLDVRGDASVSGNTSVSGNVSISGVVSVGEVTDFSFGNIPTINFDQVSNVSQIKSNSNVVMEYKLSTRDYVNEEPRAALNNTLTVDGYTVNASISFGGNTGPYGPWAAFDKCNNAGGWSGGYNSGAYSTSTGAQLLNRQHHTGSALGEWIQLDMPYAISLEALTIEMRNEQARNNTDGFPKNVYLYGSNDSTNWTLIKNFTTQPQRLSNPYHEKIGTVQPVYSSIVLVTNTVHATSGSVYDSAAIGQLRYYGSPINTLNPTGTDIVLRTTPNVPKADFSNVYYDGQDYSEASDFAGANGILDKSGYGWHGTQTGGVGFDPTYKAFTFDGVDDKITTPALGFTGDKIHTFSLWIKLNNNNSEVTNDERLFRIGDSASTTATASGVGFNSSGHVNWYSRSHDTGFAFHTEVNKWYHWVFVYSGVGAIGNGNSEGLRRSKKMYSDGIELEPEIGPGRGNTTALNFSASHNLMIGDDDQGGTPFSGSIANFRLYDHPLSADEIWELYAYQKAFFEGIPDVITFKGGRLGIGTTEPKAVLDVRGIAPTWKRANLLNSWVHYTSSQYNHPFPSYCKDLTGRVHLKGLVQNGSGNIFRLPPGYRPANTHIFAVVSNNAFGRVDVNADGDIYFSVGGNGFVSLDTISFYCN